MDEAEINDEWRSEWLPIHGSRIVTIRRNEVVRGIYDDTIATRIVSEHSFVLEARRIRERHRLDAKSKNFAECGCDYCEALTLEGL